MYGAIIGDIVGSIYEFWNIKTKDFEFFSPKCFFTDDTVMTVAVANAIMESRTRGTDLTTATIKSMQTLGRENPDAGYGTNFNSWIYNPFPQPYNSWGNGSAMRVSPCGLIATSLDEAKQLSYTVTAVTHNHPQGIRGAEATAVAIFLARNGKKIPQIKKYICDNYYNIDFTLDEIRPTYTFHVGCKNSVPQALAAFFESTSFEDAIRNTISIGGDSDTLAAITGAVAGAYYGIPPEFIDTAKTYLTPQLQNIIDKFGIFSKTINSK